MQNKSDSLVQIRAIEKLKRDLGRDLLTYLNMPTTVELMLNADGKVWVEEIGKEMREIGYLSRVNAQSILETIAGFHGKIVKTSSPILEAEFPIDGSRFAGQIPPVVQSPTFAIRKKAVAIFTLEQYVDNGIMTPEQKQVLEKAVDDHKNILVIGGTGSGKTTLVNAIINQMVINAPQERIFIIEDTGEIQCSAVNHVQFHTTLNVTMTDLLKTTLRMRPDRILVGEVRGGEALDLLDAWNTGHEGGAATLHANNAAAGLDRLKSLITRNPSAPAEIEPLIGEVVHIVVHIARTSDGRRVNEILEVKGFANGQYITNKL